MPLMSCEHFITQARITHTGGAGVVAFIDKVALNARRPGRHIYGMAKATEVDVPSAR